MFISPICFSCLGEWWKAVFTVKIQKSLFVVYENFPQLSICMELSYVKSDFFDFFREFNSKESIISIFISIVHKMENK